jgi:hypothetical protein
MSWNVSYKGATFAKARIDGIEPSLGVGHARIRTLLHLHSVTLAAPQQPPSIVTAAAQIRDVAGRHVADTTAATTDWRGGDEILAVDASLEYRTIAILNSARTKPMEDVQLGYQFEIVTVGHHGRDHARYEARHRIPGSDWAALLERAQYAALAVIEIPLSGTPVPAGFEPAMAAYAKALTHLGRCEWSDAIGACRQVYDDLDTLVDSTEPAAKWESFRERTSRESMTFQERRAGIRLMIRNATHVGHHSVPQTSSNGPIQSIAADDAKYVVELTGVALKRYVRMLSA